MHFDVDTSDLSASFRFAPLLASSYCSYNNADLRDTRSRPVHLL